MMDDVIIKQDLDSDPLGDNPLPTISLEEESGCLKTELEEEHGEGIPLSPDVAVDSDVKCEYESDPEYDDELRKVTLSQRCEQIAQKPNQKQKITSGMMQMDPKASELIIERKPYECNFCGDGFKEISELGKHVRMHYNPARVQSTSVDSHNRAEPEMLLAKVKPKTTYKNTHQKQKITSGMTMMQMDPKASELIIVRKPYECNFCGVGFKEISELGKHVRMHYNPARIQSTSVDSHDRADPETLLTKVKPKTTYKKTQQKEQSGQSTAVVKTGRINTTTKKFRPIKLNKNAMIIKPSAEHLLFRCTVCRFGFSDMIELSKHIRRARGHSRKFEMYVCSICSISFRDFRHVGDIKKHIEEHTGVLPVDVTIQDDTDDS